MFFLLIRVNDYFIPYFLETNFFILIVIDFSNNLSLQKQMIKVIIRACS